MWRALLGLLLLAGPAAMAAGTRDITLTKRFMHPWNQPGWRVFTHLNGRGQELLVAVGPRLNVEVLSPVSGATVTEDRLDTRVGDAVHLTGLSTRAGELVLAFASPRDHHVEVHGLDNPVSFEVPFNSAPTGLQLIEDENGEVLLAVTTDLGREVYRRTRRTLERDHLSEAGVAGGARSQLVQGGGKWRLWPATDLRPSILSIVHKGRRTDLAVGDAREIGHVGMFTLKGVLHHFFVRDGASLTVQSENTMTAIPTKAGERIVAATLVPGARGLAVTIEGPRSTRLTMLNLK